MIEKRGLAIALAAAGAAKRGYPPAEVRGSAPHPAQRPENVPEARFELEQPPPGGAQFGVSLDQNGPQAQNLLLFAG
jgi:hypothetical protein